MFRKLTTQPTKKFGTFIGVFTPALLTIVGVILYVRLGWVVGKVGLLGTWFILFLAMGITACTGLTLASISTNTRIGAGGIYYMITKSLGFEVGGSIGVPLYLTRPLGTAMYIFGFREGWLWVFPHHSAILVDLIVFALVYGLAYLSVRLAFHIQFLVLAVIALSLVSIVASPATFNPPQDIHWWGSTSWGWIDGSQEYFWVVFAVFFPATTGTLAGMNMSAELEDPRRSIPRGILGAMVVSFVIYFFLAFWLSRVGTPTELSNNYSIMIDNALWSPAVVVGLLGAAFSAALVGAVGGPRLLRAMGHHQLLPRSEWLEKTVNNEPHNAILLTAALTLVCLLMRDINVIAPLVTMFFLITYATINTVLLIESTLA